jgi:hypothetical protein
MISKRWAYFQRLVLCTEWVFGYKEAFGYYYAYLTHTCDDMLSPPQISFLSLLGDLFWEKEFETEYSFFRG